MGKPRPGTPPPTEQCLHEGQASSLTAYAATLSSQITSLATPPHSLSPLPCLMSTSRNIQLATPRNQATGQRGKLGLCVVRAFGQVKLTTEPRSIDCPAVLVMDGGSMQSALHREKMEQFASRKASNTKNAGLLMHMEAMRTAQLGVGARASAQRAPPSSTPPGLAVSTLAGRVSSSKASMMLWQRGKKKKKVFKIPAQLPS